MTIKLCVLHILILQTVGQCMLLENGVKIAHSRKTFKDGLNYARINESSEGSAKSWEAHTESLPQCEGKSLDELSTRGWYMTKQGHYTYEPESCMLHRISGENARRCLSGKHMVFVGDSLTRYQYVALAYFLSKMKKSESYGGLPGYPSLCIESEWLDFPQYYHFSSASPGSPAQGCATEVCDCLRDNTKTFEQTRESRTLRLMFPEPCSKDRHGSRSKSHDSLTLSYQQMFAEPDPQTAGQDALHDIELSYQHQRPDILVLNAGMHILGLPVYKDTLAFLMQAGTAVRKKHGSLLLWKSSTNGTKGPWMYRNDELELATAHGYTQYDVGRVALAAAQQLLNLTWDGIGHFLPFVYEQFNDILLNHLCMRVS